jgi:hypothetical protein
MAEGAVNLGPLAASVRKDTDVAVSSSGGGGGNP